MLLSHHIHILRRILCAALLTLVLPVMAQAATDNGLLFYLSGEQSLTADVAGGAAEPNYERDIESIPDGARGKGIQCGNSQLLAYDAPGNVYAQRGTLSFFWRGRLPIGETPFPIFRVGYSDHSSWDLVWLRIDWNGSGFESFVTDINLARPRLNCVVSPPPEPDKWVHLALSWDENTGVRFFVDGRVVAKHDTTVVLNAGLDQFGPHSRIISPYQVQSLYNYVRGGDVDEICFYDHMLDESAIADLASGADPKTLSTSPVVRSTGDRAYRDEWLLRYGWNRDGDIPPALEAASTRVRKLEIHDVYDIKQWIWKGTDGIRETTWPYVYNMSRIIGREDYFMIPDWNCYSLSGKTVTFTLPDEPWNHIEISGGAFGTMSRLAFDGVSAKDVLRRLDYRPPDQERTFHRFGETYTGGKVQFTNTLQENPIGEFMVYNVQPGAEPEGEVTLSYTIRNDTAPDNVCLEELLDYIDGRYMPDERQVAVALPSGAPRNPKTETVENAMPLVHVLIPFEFRKGRQNGLYTRFSYTWENMYEGLDGIAVDLPALDVKPTHGDLFPLNIRVLDPVWPDRVLFDFTFSVRPGEPRTIWMDTRDKILPNNYSLYMTIAGAGSDFGADDLHGARIRLVFKDRKEAVREHEIDRFTQVKDNLGNMVEEHPAQKKLRMYARYSEDMADLLRVNPEHKLGRLYWLHYNREQGMPDFEQPKAPADVPLWAFRQVENLRLCDRIYSWWIDERQIGNGEFGGGLSDDGDMTNQFPGPALMGVKPDKIRDSINSLLDAFYDQGLFTNGLSTLVTDELHTYEEGINVLPQAMMVDYGNPKTVERLLATAKAYERITGINDKGERQIKSIFYGGSKIYSEGVWAKSRPYSYIILHPGLSLVEYSGHPATRKLIVEIADGILATRHQDSNGVWRTTSEMLFPSGEGIGTSLGAGVHILWAAYRWTGDDKYLLPIMDDAGHGNFGFFSALNPNLIDHLEKRDDWGAKIASSTTPRSGNDLYRHIAWQVTGDKQYLEEYYGDMIQRNSQNMYLNTEGHWWIDRIYAYHKEVQRSRLGGVALWRNNLYPGHYLSWNIEEPATYESLAILVPDASPDKMTVIAFNLDDAPVTAVMTGWDVDPGRWEMVTGIDTDGDDTADSDITKKTVEFERTKGIGITFPPKKTTVITMKLKKRGTPYWKRPDLGISAEDIRVDGSSVDVTVHSIGSVKAPETTVTLRSAEGAVLAQTIVPVLEAPLDFEPKTATVTLDIPSGASLRGASVTIDPDGDLTEITAMNNTVVMP